MDEAENRFSLPWPRYECHAFYYAWYGTEAHDSKWLHWNGLGYNAPSEICSDYYPKLEPYSSHDETIISRHLDYLRMAGIGTIIVCWWGQGDFTDEAVREILPIAEEKEIKVGFLIDQYVGRTPSEVVNDVRYLFSEYGSHGAFYKDRLNDNRAVIYIYDILKDGFAVEDWLPVLNTLHNEFNPIFLAHSPTGDIAAVERGGFDGLFTYDVFSNDGSIFEQVGNSLRDKNKIWSPSVGPGYLEIRNKPHGQPNIIERDEGKRYIKMFEAAVRSSPTYISITSFNEWHEGTQIEPARVQEGYYNYNTTVAHGEQAEHIYLDITRSWTTRRWTKSTLQIRLGKRDQY